MASNNLDRARNHVLIMPDQKARPGRIERIDAMCDNHVDLLVRFGPAFLAGIAAWVLVWALWGIL